MDAVKYLKARLRMCKSGCAKCPLANKCLKDEIEICGAETVVSIVEKWSAEHPVKTYATDFFEKFPNAPEYRSGVPRALFENVYGINAYENLSKDNFSCWLTPMEETK